MASNSVITLLQVENILVDQHHNYVLCDFGSATTKSYIHGEHRESARDLEEDFHKCVAAHAFVVLTRHS